MKEINNLPKKVLLNTVTTIVILLALATIIVFWFPGYISFGSKIYGINTPKKTSMDTITLLVAIMGIMGATYKITRNSLQYFLIILSLAILLGHLTMVVFSSI